MKFLKKFKSIITVTIFVLWMILFDSNNVGKQLEYIGTLNKLEQERSFYQKEISENQSSTNDLISNIDKLEHYAREKYLMKKENEDIFIIIDEADAEKAVEKNER